MENDIEERINRLLDQLESRNITRSDIETIERKIALLQKMQQ